MKELPKNVQKYSQTKVFTEETVPTGLRNNHQTMKGVWGKIVILKGELKYIIEESGDICTLDKDCLGIIEPQVLHRVEIIDEVEFYVEFYK